MLHRRQEFGGRDTIGVEDYSLLVVESLNGIFDLRHPLRVVK